MNTQNAIKDKKAKPSKKFNTKKKDTQLKPDHYSDLHIEQLISNILPIQQQVLESFSQFFINSINSCNSVVNNPSEPKNDNERSNLQYINNLVTDANFKDLLTLSSETSTEITKSYSKYLQDLFSVYNLINRDN